MKIDPALRTRLETQGEVDFSYLGNGIGRFRTNIFRQRGAYSIAMRPVRSDIPGFDALGLPPIIKVLG